MFRSKCWCMIGAKCTFQCFKIERRFNLGAWVYIQAAAIRVPGAVTATAASVLSTRFTRRLGQRTRLGWVPHSMLKGMSAGGCYDHSTSVCNHNAKQGYESLWKCFWHSKCAWHNFLIACVAVDFFFLRAGILSSTWVIHGYRKGYYSLRCALCTVHCYNLPWISASPDCEVSCCLPHLSIAAFQTGLMAFLVASLAFVFSSIQKRGEIEEVT